MSITYIKKECCAWHWHLSYRLGVFTICPLSVCGAIFEDVDQSQKLEVLTVTMNFRELLLKL